MAQLETTGSLPPAPAKLPSSSAIVIGGFAVPRAWLGNAIVLITLLVTSVAAYSLPAVTLADGSSEYLIALGDRITIGGDGWVVTLSWFGVLVAALGAVCFPRAERFVQTVLITFAGLIIMALPLYVALNLNTLNADRLGSGLIVAWVGAIVVTVTPAMNLFVIDRQEKLLGYDWTKWLFILPAAFWVFALTLFPLVYAFSTSRYSFRYGSVNRNVGWQNYQRMFDISEPLRVLLTCLGIAVGVAAVVMAVGLAITYLNDQEISKTDARRVSRNIPVIAVTAIFVYLAGSILEQEVGRQLTITFIFVGGAVGTEMVLGLGIALLMNRELRGKGPLRATLTLPIFATPIAMGYLARALFYEEGGPINAGLRGLGFAGIPWLSDPTWARVSTIIVDVWQWTPFVFIIILAGLQGLPQDILEASQVDGGTWWDNLRLIIIPMIAPILWLVFLLRSIDAFKVLEIPQGLTLGGPGQETKYFSMYIYQQARQFFDYGRAAAMAFLLLFIVMVLVTLVWGRIKHIYEDEGVRA